MKILFDTNVVVDILGETEDFFESYAAYDVVLTKEFDPYITVTCVTDVEYLLAARKYMSKQKARESLEPLMEMFDVIDTTAHDCRAANKSAMRDYEDAVIAHAGKRNDIDFIVTRNKRDFMQSPVPALTPQEFLGIYKPGDIAYEMVDF